VSTTDSSGVDSTSVQQPPPRTARERERQRQLERERSGRQFRYRAALVRYAGLPFVLALSVVLNTHRLYQNGYANVFYSAGVQSMLRSFHNFLFVSFDPGGLDSIDKPPVALWVQAASAKIFGFSPLSLLLPEALAGVLTVALLYVLIVKRLGIVAAIAGSLALAVFPSFVAVSRDNGVDPVLLALMTCACGLALRACENGRWRTLILCGVAVGLAFNTKTLAAYLVVPPIAAAYLVCAPGSWRRRAAQLLVAGLAMLIVSFAWIEFVDATPASKRPYVGSSTNNSEVGLTFEYNGLGRVEGQAGGPNGVTVKPGAFVPAAHQRAVNAAARAEEKRHPNKPKPALHGSIPKPEPAPAAIAVKGREKQPIPFGPSPSLVRLFGKGLGDQAGWLLPFALFGLLGLLALALLDPPANADGPSRPDASPNRDLNGVGPRAGRPTLAGTRSWIESRRRDPRVMFAFVFGGWFLVEAAVLSISKGIVHPYYVSALAPATGAMAGAGVYAFIALTRARQPLRLAGLTLAACALATTVFVQVALLHRERYLLSFVPALAVGVAIGFAALLASRRLAAPAVVLAFLLVLVAPTAYATTTWLAPVEGTFPVAGPKSFPGPGGYGVDKHDLVLNRALIDYVSTHSPGSRWALLAVASDSAAPMMLMGLPAGALGGYSGTDPTLSGAGLARLVARGEARYVLLGGGYSLRGGNGATKAVLRACREMPPWEWHSPVHYPYGLVLFDCAGRAKGLAES